VDDADERMVPSRAMTEPQKPMIAEKIRRLFEEARSLGQRRYVPSFVPYSVGAPAVAAVTLKAGP